MLSFFARRFTIVLPGIFLALDRPFAAQELTIVPGENLVVDGIPAVPASFAETVGRYAESRYALLSDWHPSRREMLITTRFGNTNQIRWIAMPGGARRQLTFFKEPVEDGAFHPNGGAYIVFAKDVGGGEWFQLFRYDTAT